MSPLHKSQCRFLIYCGEAFPFGVVSFNFQISQSGGNISTSTSDQSSRLCRFTQCKDFDSPSFVSFYMYIYTTYKCLPRTFAQYSAHAVSSDQSLSMGLIRLRVEVLSMMSPTCVHSCISPNGVCCSIWRMSSPHTLLRTHNCAGNTVLSRRSSGTFSRSSQQRFLVLEQKRKGRREVHQREGGM